MATTQNFEVISDKLNVEYVHPFNKFIQRKNITNSIEKSPYEADSTLS
jgi:hypothetical protein